MSGTIAEKLAEIKEKETIEEVQSAISGGADPLALVESLREGMMIVGERYEAREYFLPDLIMSADIFKSAVEIIEPYIKGDQGSRSKGDIVIGTVHGDIHDIGKNLVITILSCNGYDVHDLGVDVPPQAFVDKARETGARIVAPSGLLTMAFDSMKDTVDAFTESGMRKDLKIIIGGGPINEKVIEYTGADARGGSPTDAVRLAKEYIT